MPSEGTRNLALRVPHAPRPGDHPRIGSGSAVYGPAQRSIAPTDWINWAGGGKLWRGAP